MKTVIFTSYILHDEKLLQKDVKNRGFNRGICLNLEL